MKKLAGSNASQGSFKPKVWHWRMYHEMWHRKFYAAADLLFIRKVVVKREVWNK